MVAAVVARGRPVGTIRQTYFASAEDRCAAGEAAPAPGELELAALPLGGFGLAWLANATSWALLSWTANARRGDGGRGSLGLGLGLRGRHALGHLADQVWRVARRGGAPA